MSTGVGRQSSWAEWLEAYALRRLLDVENHKPRSSQDWWREPKETLKFASAKGAAGRAEATSSAAGGVCAALQASDAVAGRDQTDKAGT